MYDDIIFKLGEFANEAMIYEVSSFPAFGLVSPISSGSHKDMDFYTFVDSTSTLNRYFLEMAHIGYSDDSIEDIFNKIRKIGIRAEKAMFEKTNGINTHKGMIFVLGLTITATSYCIFNKFSFDKISDIIKNMTKGIIENDLKFIKDKPIENLTHGEKIFLKYNVTGVRGEAENGFDFIFNEILGIYDDITYKSQNQRLTNTLLAIMSSCEDTTILYRHDYSTLLNLQKKSKKIIDLGGIINKNTIDLVEKLNIFNEKNNISPGGCADLLALTVFLSKVKKQIKTFTCNY